MYSLLGGGGGEGSGKGGEEVPTEVLSSGGDFFDEVSSSSAGSRSLQRQAVETAPLKTPPKWFRRPCGASFTVCEGGGAEEGRREGCGYKQVDGVISGRDVIMSTSPYLMIYVLVRR